MPRRVVAMIEGYTFSHNLQKTMAKQEAARRRLLCITTKGIRDVNTIEHNTLNIFFSLQHPSPILEILWSLDRQR